HRRDDAAAGGAGGRQRRRGRARRAHQRPADYRRESAAGAAGEDPALMLNVNGRKYEVESGTRTLLAVLRDELQLTGAKEGCGIGMCGACTGLLDGRPISSCAVAA